MPRRRSHVSNTGLSLRHLPAADAAAGFSCEVFLQSASGTNIAGMGHGTLVSVGFF